MADTDVGQFSAEEIAFLAHQPPSYVFASEPIPAPDAQLVSGQLSPDAAVGQASEISPSAFHAIGGSDVNAFIDGRSFPLEQVAGFTQLAFADSEMFTFGNFEPGPAWQPDFSDAFWDMLLA